MPLAICNAAAAEESIRAFKNTMLFRGDPCGIVCIAMTYAMLVHCLYAMIFVIILPFLNDSFYGTLNTLLICTFVLLSLTSHARAAYSDPGFVPLPKKGIDFSDVKPNESDTNHSKSDDGWTVCNRCDTYRPARSHHCRICRRCVRRLDHHCPWINNCVGEFNQKYFLLFLVYIGVTSLYVLALVIWSLIVFSHKSDAMIIHSIVICIESALFGIFVVSILVDQIESIINDRSLIEALKQTDRSRTASHVLPSKRILFRRVFGSGPMILWLFPCELWTANQISDSHDFYHV